MNGASGSSGSMDPNNPSPGGNGGNGTDGSNGGDGGSGGNAPPVKVQVTLRSGSHPLLQASVSAAGHQRLYLVDPQGGSLTVKADGGSGGQEEEVAAEAKEARGYGNAQRKQREQRLRRAERFDGRREGGSITVTYDPLVKPFLGTIHLSNQNGPPPVFKEEPVAALW